MRTLEIFTKSSWGNKISSEYLKEIHLQKRYWTGPPELCRLHSLGGNWTCHCFGDYKLGLRCLWGHTVFVSLDCLKPHKHFQSLKSNTQQHWKGTSSVCRLSHIQKHQLKYYLKPTEKNYKMVTISFKYYMYIFAVSCYLNIAFCNSQIFPLPWNKGIAISPLPHSTMASKTQFPTLCSQSEPFKIVQTTQYGWRSHF